MRAVRADGELELKQEFVRSGAERVVGAPVLPANLAELARPVREDQRPARIEQQSIMTARIRRAEIDVAVLGDVLVRAQMSDVTHLAASRRLEQRASFSAGIAAEDLSRRFEEQPRIRNQTRDRKPRVADAVFTA